MKRDYEGGSDARFDTLAVREGQHRGPEGEHNDPVFLTSSFAFRSAEEAAARFAETEPGNVYSRFTNPTVRTFEERLAALEGGARCVATASGMGAILTLGLAILKAGDHVVVSRNVFGSTISLFNNIFARFGVDATYVDLVDLDQWHDAIRPETRLLLLESPSNPLGEAVDIQQVAALARERGARLAVDNVMCTPALQRPLALGADVVVHSATKYLDGQGRCVGGAIVTNDDAVGDEAYKIMRTAGPSMSPFNAWVFLKGLETLRLRMQAHCANALAVARWLETHPAVERVHYLGLERHPQHRLARRQQRGFGGIVSFEVRGGARGGVAGAQPHPLAVHHREPRRRQDHHHPSRLHHPQSHHRRRAGRGRSERCAHPGRGGAGRSRGHQGGSGARPRRAEWGYPAALSRRRLIAARCAMRRAAAHRRSLTSSATRCGSGATRCRSCARCCCRSRCGEGSRRRRWSRPRTRRRRWASRSRRDRNA